MREKPTRREVLAGVGGALGGAVAAGVPTGRVRAAEAGAAAESGGHRFLYGLNTATIRGQDLGLDEQIEVAIEAGYDAIEPWIGDIRAYQEGGGSLEDIARRCRDAGLMVAGGIGFAAWIVDDDAQRAAGLEQARRDMELLERIGGTHLAAPPVGAHQADAPELDLRAAAERYHKLLEAGREAGVIPQVEVWGFSKNLSRISDAVYIAAESGHPDARILADEYHNFRGGSDPHAIRQLARQAVHCYHINDYPAMDRHEATDADRVYPGDGDGPLDVTLRHLAENHCEAVLSLELFNRDYWAQPALEVARTGLDKTKAAVRRALA